MSGNTPTKDHYDYANLISESFKSVVINILKRSKKEGILGDHHFYITFETQHADVEIPEELHTAYPSEMTIILQFEYFDLITEDDYFAVTLHFNKVPSRLKIPYNAIIAFFDPSVDIRLFLKNPAIGQQNSEQEFSKNKNQPEKLQPAKKSEKAGVEKTEIISLDKFRSDKK